MTSPLHQITRAIEARDDLDAIAKPLGRLSGKVESIRPLFPVLEGVPWLGHPLHPVLTDYPIGFWTSTVALDLFGGERAEAAADGLLGLGIAAAVPTAASGLVEYGRVRKPTTRVATVHAVANTIALTLMTLSLGARLVGMRGFGKALALAGTGVLGFGGYLGGHLSFEKAIGVEEQGSA